MMQAVAPLGGPDEQAPRQTLPTFAAALFAITIGAFALGSAIRKYILQPTQSNSRDKGGGSSSSSGKGSGKRRSSSKGGKGGLSPAPGVRELLAQQGEAPEELPGAPPSSQPSSPAVAADTAATTLRQAQTARQVATTVATAATAAAVAATTTEVSAAQTYAEAALAAKGASAGAAGAGAGAGGAPGLPSPAEEPAAAAAAAAPIDVLADAVPAAGRKAAEPDWCTDTLGPAMAAASATKAAERKDGAAKAAAVKQAALQGAALVAASPLLACEAVWVLMQQSADGPVMLRLLFPVPGGQEQKCVALFQVRAGWLGGWEAA
jgi:hypothetical protein